MRKQGLTTKQKLKLEDIISSKAGRELDDAITGFFAQYTLDIPVKEDKSKYDPARSKLWT